LASPDAVPVVDDNVVYVVARRKDQDYGWHLVRLDFENQAHTATFLNLAGSNDHAWPPLAASVGGQPMLAIVSYWWDSPRCYLVAPGLPPRLVRELSIPIRFPVSFAVVGSDLYLAEDWDTRLVASGGPAVVRVSLEEDGRVVWRVLDCTIMDSEPAGTQVEKLLATTDGLYITADASIRDDVRVVRLDPDSGAVRWKVPGRLLALSEGVVLAAAIAGPEATTADVLALDAKDGAVLWRARPSAGIPEQAVTDGKWMVCVSHDEARREAVFDVFSMPKWSR
jgi:hypothetical protein